MRATLLTLKHPAQRLRLRTEALALWQLAWPILVGQLAVMAMAVVDVAMAGHASAQDLAGVSLGVSIWNLLMLGLMGLMMSINPTVAHLVGAGQLDRIAAVVQQALWQALIAGAVALGLAQWAALLFAHMAIESRVAQLAHAFVSLSSWSLPAFALYRVLHGYSTSLNQTKPLMVIALGALGLNIAVNSLLVFGLWGAPRLGGLGCAWATLATVSFNLLALVLWMRLSPAYRASWPLTNWRAPDWAQILALFSLGWPIGLTYLAESSAFSLIALLIAEWGSVEVAAHQIVLNITSVVFMLPLSLGLALLTRVGQSVGAGERVRARFQAWLGLGVGWMLAGLTALLIASTSAQLGHFYTQDAHVVARCASLLMLAAAFQLSDATQVIASCATRGYKVTRPPMLIHLAAFGLVALPLGVWLGLRPAWLPATPWPALGAQGFWAALVVGLTLAALGQLILMRQVARR